MSAANRCAGADAQVPGMRGGLHRAGHRDRHLDAVVRVPIIVCVAALASLAAWRTRRLIPRLRAGY